MKFKFGDKVRFTREYMRYHWYSIFDTHQPLITGSKIDGIEGQKYIINCKDRPEEALELVPEKPEFTRGEEIEVSDDGERRLIRTFIAKLPNEKKQYLIRSDIFPLHYTTCKYARKLRPQLTRKEIAKKFGVGEDFTLVD